MPATLSHPTPPLRRPRFRRVETPPPFQLTARDLAILHAVARYRFLSSTLIISLVGGSAQQILRRLQLLFHHGYLDRPTSQVAQLAHVFDFGNRPFIYGLGPRRRPCVLAEAGIPLKESWIYDQERARHRTVSLAHTLETADTMIAFELACRAEGAPMLIDHHDLLPYLPEETRDDDAPFHARVTLKTAREALTIGVIPDRRRLASPSKTARASILRSNSIAARWTSSHGSSSVNRALATARRPSALEEELHTSQWGFKAFRVLTVTPSEKRIENMIAVQREIVGEQGSNLFLFTTPKRLAEKSPLADVWVTGKGARRLSYHDHSRADTTAISSVGSSFGWPGFWRGPRRCQGRASRFPAAAFSASLDNASCARAIFTAIQMRSSPRLTKYSETVRLQ